MRAFFPKDSGAFENWKCAGPTLIFPTQQRKTCAFLSELIEYASQYFKEVSRMKAARLEIQWLEKEDRRRSLRASVCRDGKLHLGKSLRKKLPQSIRVGFDANSLVLAIADGHGNGIDCPACGVLSFQTLTSRIFSAGLRLPVSFLMAKDAQTGYFLGRIIPRRRVSSTGKSLALTWNSSACCFAPWWMISPVRWARACRWQSGRPLKLRSCALRKELSSRMRRPGGLSG